MADRTRTRSLLPSDPINRANTPFHVFYLDPSGLGPTSTNGGSTWTSAATSGLSNVLQLPGPVTVPKANFDGSAKNMSLRVDGQPFLPAVSDKQARLA